MISENKFILLVLFILAIFLILLSVPFLPCKRYETHQVFVIEKPPSISHYTTREICTERQIPFF